jgi:DNA-binding transcriptional ArsR family regulator
MESVFEIIAEPNRRAILSLLVSSEQSVGEIERQLRMAQPTVSKHLRVLREAGLVEVRADAQRRLYRLRTEPLREVDEWLAPYRAAWRDRLTLTDTFDDVGKAARDAAGWHECLDRLVSDLDGTAQPPKGERWRQIHPVYVAELGPEASTIGPPAGLP